MNKEILSARQVGKTLKSWNNYIEQINDMKVKYDDYVLYINKYYYKTYKDRLGFTDIKIEITDKLPKHINAIYMKKTNLDNATWLENSEKEVIR